MYPSTVIIFSAGSVAWSFQSFSNEKLTPRKLWVAVAGFISGLIVAYGGGESAAFTVSGVILQGAAVVVYGSFLTNASADVRADERNRAMFEVLVGDVYSIS